jgi:RHH-type proline utilization regulon transcriptional repressor/proline dehydrogenase/delta 1-pyrroline-5-carboxylate dehydrogenase
VIAFTGSVAVGLEIIRSAAERRDGQHHVKRVVAEMGGKNTIIVDSDADLDDAVPGIVASAFGYAGQKCSAAGRVLVHEAVADQLLDRLTGAVRTLQVGAAEDLETDVPAVIDEEARERVGRFGAIAEREGRLVATTDALPDGGWYCAPMVASDLPESSRVLQEEIFGPLLAVTPVPSIRAATELIERMPYALTGGLFTRNPRVIDEIARLTPVGNLYVNRGSTGAKVGRQPFGGSKLSGTGPKAGGPDYLTAFGDAHVVTENTVRHGLMIE